MNRGESGATGREILISVAIGTVLVGFLLLAFLQMGRKSAEGGAHGVITEMQFTPFAERQITIGRGGVNARDSAGEYRLTVRVGEGEAARDYFVFVDPRVYAQHKVGDRYFFVSPPESPAPSPSTGAPASPGGPPTPATASPGSK